jgi:hypothetical protein
MRPTDYITRTISPDLQQRSRSASTRPVDEVRSVPDVWYCADQNRPLGPLPFESLLTKLLTLPNAADALVWCDRFSGWRRAGDVSEFKPHILVPPTLPGSVLAQPPLVGAVGNTSDHDQGPWKWRFRWWWLFAALPVVVLLSVKVAVGNHLGRSELERLSVERQARRKARKESRTRTADA